MSHISPSPPSPLLKIVLLGNFELSYQASPQEAMRSLPLPPTAKSQSLLAYLILHPDPPPTREQLATLFWAERPPRRARRSLSTALWHIRRCFPEAPLQSDHHAVQFRFPGALWVDVHEFERLTSPDASVTMLREGIALYRGDLLEGFYDDWIISLRYRWQTGYLDALLRLMRALEARGEDRAALDAALRLLEQDPLSETACQVALRACARLGQRETGIRLYRRFEAVLRRDLDTAPQAETTSLYRALLSGERAPARKTTPPALLPHPSPKGRVPWSDIAARPPLVGRESELRRLREAWAEVVQGRGKALWLQGEAGIGKTRLVTAFGEHVRQRGGRVLIGHCPEFEGEQPYAPLVEILQSALAGHGKEALAHLSPWQAALLARLCPSLGEGRPPESQPALPAEAEQRYLFQASIRFLHFLARRAPLLLVLEDLHLAHTSTLAWWQMLVRDSRQAPILLLGTLRSEEVASNPSLAHLLWEQNAEREAQAIELPPLLLDDLHRWIPSADPSLRKALYQHTEGNPFFVLETLRALLENGQLYREGETWRLRSQAEALPVPETVRQAVQMRWHGLPPLARQALEIAAVIGRAFDLDIWQRAWGEPEETLLEALDTLLRRRWLVEGSGPFARDYEFAHHLGRETVYQGLSAAHRRTLHRRVAQALEAARSPEQARRATARTATRRPNPKRAPCLSTSGSATPTPAAHRTSAF